MAGSTGVAGPGGSAQALVRTFLIADVRGYTNFTRHHGDEAAATLAMRFADVSRLCVEEHEGKVLGLRGDELAAAFGSPRQALRAAVVLQQRLAEELRSDPTLPLLVGIGLDAGETVAVEDGYRGGALNFAARLCSLAKAGEVLVSDAVEHLAGRQPGITFRDRGHRRVKGFARPIHVNQAVFALDLPQLPKPSTQRPTRTRVGAVAAGLVIVIAAGAVIAASRLGGSSHGTGLGTDMVGVLDASGKIAGEVAMDGRPGGVAVGAGSIWATDTTSNTVVQINPTTRAIVNRIPTGMVDPTGVAVGGGGVWVADSGAGAVSWINARTPGPPTTIPVGQGPGPIAYGSGHAWVVNTTDGTLQRLDPRNPSVTGTMTIGAGGLAAVAVGGGRVWVTDTTTRSMFEIDPRSLRVVDHFGVGNDPVAVTYAFHRVWVDNAADDTVTRLDPTTGKESTIPVGHHPSGLSSTPSTVWTVIRQPASLVRIDPHTLHTDSTVLHSLPDVVAGAPSGAAWVTALAPPGSHRGGTLRVVLGNAGGNPFDPAGASYPVDWQVLSMTNDGLVAYRRVGGANGTQVVPDLAVGMPTVSRDGRTYTFHLRRGIHYSNGQVVRASDFRYAVTRQLHPTVANPYYAYVVFSNLLGYPACVASPRTCSLARTIQADDRTGQITIHLVRPDPDFLTKLATVFGDLVPPGSPPPSSNGRVVATGPYVVGGRSARGWLLVRNPRFHQWSAAAQPAGYPDQIRYTFVETPDAELTAVEHRAADVMLDQPTPRRRRDLLTSYQGLAHPYDSLSTAFLSLNTRVPPFRSRLARQAFNLAIDRNRVVDYEGGPLVAAPTCQMLPPGMPGHTPYCPYTANPTPSGTWSGPDITRALRLVRESHTAGERVTILGDSHTAPDAPLARYLATVLRSLGYRAAVQTIEANRNYDAWARAARDSRSGTQAVLDGWAADYPSPPDFLGLLLTCDSFVPGSSANLNESEFCDPRLDTLMRAAGKVQSAGNPSAAVTLWQQADRTAVDQAPWVPLFTPVGPDVISTRVGDYQHNTYWGVLLDQLWVR